MFITEGEGLCTTCGEHKGKRGSVSVINGVF